MQKMVYIVFNPTTTKSGAKAVCQRLRLNAVDILEAQTIPSFTGKVTKIK